MSDENTDLTFYGTASGFRTYAAQRAYVYPTQEDEEIEGALLVASEWLDGTYRPAFMAVQKSGYIRYGVGTFNADIGTYKTGGRNQVREWPRNGFVDSYGYPIGANEIPREIEMATYEAAFRQIVSPGSLRTDFTNSKYSDVTVFGAIAVKYDKTIQAADVQTQIPAIDAILANLIGSSEVTSSMSVQARRG